MSSTGDRKPNQVAWWGLILACCSLGWQIFTFIEIRRPRVAVSVDSDFLGPERTACLVLDISNTGGVDVYLKSADIMKRDGILLGSFEISSDNLPCIKPGARYLATLPIFERDLAAYASTGDMIYAKISSPTKDLFCHQIPLSYNKLYGRVVASLLYSQIPADKPLPRISVIGEGTCYADGAFVHFLSFSDKAPIKLHQAKLTLHGSFDSSTEQSQFTGPKPLSSMELFFLPQHMNDDRRIWTIPVLAQQIEVGSEIITTMKVAIVDPPNAGKRLFGELEVTYGDAETVKVLTVPRIDVDVFAKKPEGIQ